MKPPKGWKSSDIDGCAEFVGGSQPPLSTFIDEPQPGYVRLLQIRDYKSDRYATYIPENLSKRWCEIDDIMIGRYGPPIFQILRGKCGSYNVALIKAAPRPVVHRDFLFYTLKREDLFQLIDRLSSRTSGQTGIDMDALKAFPIALPPLPEQRKIADILSTWDEALETLDALIAAKDRQKQALIQHLLTGKTRVKGFDSSRGKTKSDRFGVYPGDWRKVALSDIIEEVSARNADSQNLPVLSCTKHRGLVLSKEYFGKRVHAEDTSGYRVVRSGEFAYATNHIEEGSIGYQNLVDAGLVSPIYTVFKTRGEIDDNYLFRVFKSPLLLHFYQINTSASVDRRGSLRYDEFSRIRIWLPSKPEQLAIAAILDTADEELTLLRTQRTALDQQKRGLMQRLLTGKTRVKP